MAKLQIVGRQEDRRREIRHVEQRDLRARRLSQCVRGLADADDMAGVDRVEECRVPAQHQLAGDSGLRWIGEVERVQGIGLAECRHIADRPGEANRVDLLTGTKPAGLADDVQLAAELLQHIDRGLGGRLLDVGCGDVVASRRDSKRALPGRQGVLRSAGRAEQPARDRARCIVHRPAWC